MNARVVLVAEAEKHLRDIDRWWVANRRAAPNLFLSELEIAFDLLSQMPEIGSFFQSSSRPGVRRYLLRRSKYWVYYVHDKQRALVLVLAIWSTFRGSDPELPEARL